tara:strand:+ start:38 stop:460 length:423 start_codon:yes stop_codon:yes gene_type:complete
MAKRTKLSPDIINSICSGLESGNYVTTMLKELRIAQSTYYKWLKEADTKSPQSLQYKLKQRVEESEAKSEQLAVKAWVNHFDTDWRAPKEFLARRHSDKWGAEPTQVQLSGSDKGLPVTFLLDTPNIAPNIKLLEDKEDS